MMTVHHEDFVALSALRAALKRDLKAVDAQLHHLANCPATLLRLPSGCVVAVRDGRPPLAVIAGGRR